MARTYLKLALNLPIKFNNGEVLIMKGVDVNNGKSLINKPATRQFLMESIGEEGLKVVRSLVCRETTDEEIAEKTGLKLNTVRKILYKLYDYRLASYVRTKEKDIGWYIYTWKLDLGGVRDILMARKKTTLRELVSRLEYEKSHAFFICKNGDCKVTFDVASEHNFKCPKCSGIMDYNDNQGNLLSLEGEVNRLQK